MELVEIGTPFPTESASPVFVSAPVPQVVGELTEASKVFSQDKLQQRFGEQTIETPAVSPDEKSWRACHTQKNTKQVVNTHVQMSTHTTHQQLFTPTVDWKRDGSPSHEKWWNGTWSLTNKTCHCDVQEERSSEHVNINLSPSLQLSLSRVSSYRLKEKEFVHLTRVE